MTRFAVRDAFAALNGTAPMEVSFGKPKVYRLVYPSGSVRPAGTAALIDQLRADGVVLTYDLHDRTLRTDGHDRLSVTSGMNH
jgi:hypothetical protein